ncbi:hypothetical protein [Saccharothrix sp. Mg75]
MRLSLAGMAVLQALLAVTTLRASCRPGEEYAHIGGGLTSSAASAGHQHT